MQKIARASQSRIVFGYITALQMLRMAQPCELASVRSGKPSIPERAPRTKELSSALERIEGDHPGLRFERPSHVLVSTPNGRAGELCVPHVCTRGFSRSSFFRLGDDVFFSKPELAFIQMATRIRNEVSLLELGWELCGSYQTRRTGASVGYDVEPLTSVRALRDYVACNSSLGGALLVGCGCAASHLELSAGVRRCSEPRCFWRKVAEFGNRKTDWSKAAKRGVFSTLSTRRFATASSLSFKTVAFASLETSEFDGILPSRALPACKDRLGIVVGGAAPSTRDGFLAEGGYLGRRAIARTRCACA